LLIRVPSVTSCVFTVRSYVAVELPQIRQHHCLVLRQPVQSINHWSVLFSYL